MRNMGEEKFGKEMDGEVWETEEEERKLEMLDIDQQEDSCSSTRTRLDEGVEYEHKNVDGNTQKTTILATTVLMNSHTVTKPEINV